MGAADAIAEGALGSLGFIQNDGSTDGVMRSQAWYHRPARTTMDVGGMYTETYGLMEINTAYALDWGLKFHDFDTDGFTVIVRNAGANNNYLFYLALNFGGVADVKVATVDSPTSTGNDAQTWPGFTPQFVMVAPSMKEAVDTAYGSGLGATHGFGVFDSNNEFCASFSGEDGVATANTQSLTDDVAIELPDDDGGAGLTANFVSFDATGYTLNWTAVEGNAKKMAGLAIEGVAAAPPAGMELAIATRHLMTLRGN